MFFICPICKTKNQTTIINGVIKFKECTKCNYRPGNAEVYFKNRR